MQCAADPLGLSDAPWRTLVVMDCEATGLERGRLTELCLIAVHRVHMLPLECINRSALNPPRVLHKLTMCFNPLRHVDHSAAKITKLNSAYLEHCPEFTTSSVILIKEFIRNLDPPVLLVGHNITKFDLPLVLTELQSIGCTMADICHSDFVSMLFADSLLLFRETASFGDISLSGSSAKRKLTFENGDSASPAKSSHQLTGKPILCEDTKQQSSHMTTQNKQETDPAFMSTPTTTNHPRRVSFQLNEVFFRKFGHYPAVSHCAEDDAMNLLLLLQSEPGDCLHWLDHNYHQVDQVKPLYTPKMRAKCPEQLYPYRRSYIS